MTGVQTCALPILLLINVKLELLIVIILELVVLNSRRRGRRAHLRATRAVAGQGVRNGKAVHGNGEGRGSMK